MSKGPVQIGNNVWLANKVAVMPGVTIGDDAIIAANAVVRPPVRVVATGIAFYIIDNIS